MITTLVIKSGCLPHTVTMTTALVLCLSCTKPAILLTIKAPTNSMDDQKEPEVYGCSLKHISMLLPFNRLQIFSIIIRTSVTQTLLWDIILNNDDGKKIRSGVSAGLFSQRDDRSLWINVSVWQEEKWHETPHLFHIRLRLSIKGHSCSSLPTILSSLETPTVSPGEPENSTFIQSRWAWVECVHTHTHIHVHIHTHIRTYTLYMHIHTHVHTPVYLSWVRVGYLRWSSRWAGGSGGSDLHILNSSRQVFEEENFLPRHRKLQRAEWDTHTHTNTVKLSPSYSKLQPCEFTSWMMFAPLGCFRSTQILWNDIDQTKQ